MVRKGAPGSSGEPRLQDSGQQTAGCKPTPEDVLGKKLSKLSLVKALGCQQMMSSIIHKWKKLGTVVNLPSSDNPTRITPRAQLQLNQELKKDPRTTSVELQASLGTVKVLGMYPEGQTQTKPSDHLPTNKVAGFAAKTQTDPNPTHTVSQSKKHIVRHILFIKLQKAIRVPLLTRTRKNMVPLDEEEGSSGASSVSFDGHLESTNLVPPSLASEEPDYPRGPSRKRLCHAIMDRPLTNMTFSIHTKPQRKERTRAKRKRDLLKHTLLQSHMRKVLSLDKEELQAMFPTESQKLNLVISVALNGECET